jgi:hypothetical protein
MKKLFSFFYSFFFSTNNCSDNERLSELNSMIVQLEDEIILNKKRFFAVWADFMNIKFLTWEYFKGWSEHFNSKIAESEKKIAPLKAERNLILAERKIIEMYKTLAPGLSKEEKAQIINSWKN